MATTTPPRVPIPRDSDDDASREAADRRRAFVAERTGASLDHVSSYGGGTGLATQRECLEMLGCYGTGNVRKLTEIVAATVLCGELSLGSAIVSEEWVRAHDLLGRNRP
jgi:hydroxymethylglutaryl-CoA reductase